MKLYLDSNDSVTSICYSFLESIQVPPSYSCDGFGDFISLPLGWGQYLERWSREMGNGKKLTLSLTLLEPPDQLLLETLAGIFSYPRQCIIFIV